MTEMAYCDRCGIRFDPTPFIPGAPCEDCQYEYPYGEWIPFDVELLRESQRLQRHIERLWEKRYSDREIAEVLGVARVTVGKIRRNMDLPAHQFSGSEKWHDPEAVKAATSARFAGKTNKERAKDPNKEIAKGVPVQGSLEGYMGSMRRRGMIPDPYKRSVDG